MAKPYTDDEGNFIGDGVQKGDIVEEIYVVYSEKDYGCEGKQTLMHCWCNCEEEAQEKATEYGDLVAEDPGCCMKFFYKPLKRGR